MHDRLRWLMTLLIVFALGVSASAKGLTTRITITGPDLIAPIEITDPDVLRQFGIWEGPGVRSNGIEQKEGFVIDWPAGVVAERPTGLHRYEVSFFVKYQNRPLVNQPAKGLPLISTVEPLAGWYLSLARSARLGPLYGYRDSPHNGYKVLVTSYEPYSGPEQLAYVVSYESDAASAQGYIYLPGRGDEWYVLNTRAIHRRLEGNWFRATGAWQQAVAPLLAQAKRQ